MDLIAKFVGFFKPGRQPYMKLDMPKHDDVVAMTAYQGHVVVATREGRIFLIETDTWG